MHKINKYKFTTFEGCMGTMHKECVDAVISASGVQTGTSDNEQTDTSAVSSFCQTVVMCIVDDNSKLEIDASTIKNLY